MILDDLLCFVGTLIAFPFSFRNRVVATLGKGIATQDAPNGQDKANDEAPLLKSFNGVGRTGRSESATGWFKGRNKLLIKFHQINTDVFHPLAFSVFSLRSDSFVFLKVVSS